MLILGINGSPRQGGNSEILLEHALQGCKTAGAKIKKINLGELKYAPCLSCAETRKDGVCKIKDDMSLVYAAFEKADGIIIASPVYFGSVSAQLKMFIDRFQCYWAAKYVHKTVKPGVMKPGAFISVQAGKNTGFFENSRAVVRNLFVTLDIKYTGELTAVGLEEKAAVLNDVKSLLAAEELGVQLARKGGK
ncbi:MAG: flavodoxin family protein [Candidatus Firestonebacteria bacterium]